LSRRDAEGGSRRSLAGVSRVPSAAPSPAFLPDPSNGSRLPRGGNATADGRARGSLAPSGRPARRRSRGWTGVSRVAVAPTRGSLGGACDPRPVGPVAPARAATAHSRLAQMLALVVADPGHKRAETPADVRHKLARLAFAELSEATIELDPFERTVYSLEER